MAEMTFTIAGGPGIEVHVEEIEGDLRFTVTVLGEGGLTADIRGVFFDLAGVTIPDGLTLTSSDGSVTEFRASEDGVINLGAGANMNGAADPFDVGIEIGTAGIGQDDWQTTSFVLSADEALSLNFIASQIFGVRLTSVGEEDGARTDGLKLVGTVPDAPDGNEPPVAVDDAATTDEDTAITIDVAGNDSDPDGDTLTVSLDKTTSDLGATLSLDENGRIIYDPTGSTELGALNSGDAPLQDSFTYIVTDANGATSTATVTVTVNGVTDGPVDGFDGKALTYVYDYLPGTANGYAFEKEVVVGSGVEVPELSGGGIYDVGSLDITNTQLVIDYYQAGVWEPGGFNGFRITDTYGTLAEIKGVTIAESNMVGFDEADITIAPDGNSLSVNWVGLSFTADTRIVLDVIFG